MSFTGAPNTPLRVQCYVTPSKFTGMMGNLALAVTEACYLHAQGYTEAIFYGLQNYDSGGTFSAANKAKISAIIDVFNTRGIECCVAFTGTNTLDATIDYNNTMATKFLGVVSENEAWNYSANLPWVSQDASGNRSFYDLIETFKTRRAALTAAELELITYNGWTKTSSATSPSAIYDSGLPVLSFDVAANKIVVQGDFSPLGIAGGKQFEVMGGAANTGANQVVKVVDFPRAGATTFFEVNNVLQAFGNTEIYCYPNLNNCFSFAVTSRSLTSNVATLVGTFSAGTGAYKLAPGDRITVSGLSAPYNGNFTITAVTGTSISYAVTNANLASVVAPGTVVLRYSGSLASEVKLSYNIHSLGTNQLIVRGDKTFRFAGTNRVTRINVTDGNGANTLFIVNGTPSYNSGTKLTTIPVTASTAAFTPVTGFPVQFRGFADFDVSGKVDISYSALFGFASQQEMMYELVDLVLIHIYTSIPSYSYGRSRMIENGLAGLNTGRRKNVGFIVSAEGAFSGPWFSGAGGAPKTVEQAYQYIVKSMSATLPAQTGSPLYAQFESNVNINNWLDITTITIFKDDLMQALTLGNGPNIYVDAGVDQTITNSSPGSASLVGTYCDDGLGGAHTILWTIISQPAGSPVSTLANANNVNATLNYQRPGLYVLQMRVTDAQGITDVAITNVIILSASVPLNLSADATATSCYAVNDGEINAIASGGVGPYTYSITQGAFSASNTTGAFTGLAYGVYVLSVVDSLGATATVNVTVTRPTQIFPNLTTTQADCAPFVGPPFYEDDLGNATQFNVTDTGIGVPPVITQGSGLLNIQTTGNIGNDISVYAAFQSVPPLDDPYPTCEYIVTLQFTKIEQDVTVNIITGSSPTPATLNLTPLSSLTQTFKTGNFPSNLDFEFLLTESSVSLKEIEVSTISVSNDPLCNLLPTSGTGTVIPTGGVAPYNITWATAAAPGVPIQSDGSVLTSTLEAAPGSYIVTVEDINGCQATSAFSIVQAPPIVISSNITNAGCYGANNGAIDISVVGGVGPYTYQWSGGSSATTADISSLYAGSYTILVTDSNGCTETATITLTEFSAGSVTIDGKRAFCENEDLDLASTVTGGLAAFTYKWFADGVLVGTNPELSIPPLSVGFVHTVELEVTDANGCVFRDLALITFDTNTLPAIAISNSGPALTSCPGSQITLTASGQGANTVNWECIGVVGSLGTGASIIVDNIYFFTNGSDPDPLVFQATITNGNCSSIATISVPYPVSVTIEISLITPNVCGGALNTGAIDINVINGCAPFTFAWTGPGGFTATTQNISGLVNGFYNVTVSDSVGNSTSGSATIITSNPTIDSFEITDNCRQGNYGAIDIVVSGGTEPYTYAWTGPNGFTSTLQNLSNIAVGSYTVIVTDDKGCTATGTYTVINSFLSVDLIVTNLGCDGSNGLIQAVVTGGNTPVTYLWDNGSTASSRVVTTGGNYWVIVSCENGCSIQKYAFVPQTVGIQTSIYGQNPSTDTSSDGWAIVNVSGGSGIYTYLWDDGTTTSSNYNLSAGTHIVTVTDFNGCVSIQSITLLGINEPPVDPDDAEKKRYSCCAANIAYLSAIAERTGSSRKECLEFQSLFISAVFAVYCDMKNVNSDCLTDDEKLKIIRILDEVCNECKDCQ